MNEVTILMVGLVIGGILSFPIGMRVAALMSPRQQVYQVYTPLPIPNQENNTAGCFTYLLVLLLVGAAILILFLLGL